MLLRRVMDHVKTQNWLAVSLDFMIVILGVFIGIQLGNWNEARENRHEYDLAVDRYVAEAQTNIETLVQLEKEIDLAVEISQTAFEALLTCEETPENRALIENGLLGTSGTYGLNLRLRALGDLTEQQHLLAQQTEEERQFFSNVRFTIDLFLREAYFVETIPLESWVPDNANVGVGELVDRRVTYTGVDYSRKVRGLTLDVPVDVACQDNELKKAFYKWEKWQGTLPTIVGILRNTLETSLNELETVR